MKDDTTVIDGRLVIDTSYEDFRKDLAELLNRYGKDNELNVPDFLLAGYLHRCLDNLETFGNDFGRWEDSEDDRSPETS